MQIVRDHLHHWNKTSAIVILRADRGTLAKRRWRGIADDGAEFGFDLEHPLADGDVIASTATVVYALKQNGEPVLEVALGQHPAEAARLGWLIGNLHFPIGIEGDVVQLVDDPALRHLLAREEITFILAERVFRPLGGGHSHDHR